MPQVVGADRKPLSKRHGSTSVEHFREQGYLPEAMVNYLALLGWSPGDDREVLTRDELVDAFDLSRVSSNPAAFDTEKLTWLNNHLIQGLDDDDLAARCVHFLAEAGLGVDPVLLRQRDAAGEGADEDARRGRRPARVPVQRRRDPEREGRRADREGARRATSRRPPTRSMPWTTWDAAQIGGALDELATSAGLNRTKGWQPVRAAATGSNVSPPLPESLELLGRERTVARIRACA